MLFSIGSLAGGGAERQTLLYLRHLDRSRFAPQLLLTYRRGELLDQVPADVPLVAFWDRHRFPRWNLPGRIHHWQVADLARILNERRIEVLVSVTFQATLVAAAAVRRRPTSWLAVEMADPRRDLKNQVSRFRWLKRQLLTRAYRQADRAVAVSEGVRQALAADYGPPPDRLVVLPNFVDLVEIQQRAAAAGPALAPDRFHIAAVGRLNEQKGHIYLLQALEQLVHQQQLPCHVHLIGQGPLEPELRRFVQQRQLEQHVTFTGFLANPLPYIRQCQLFCLPSLYEGLPLALLEAMACGVPVLAADCPSGPREVLAEGALGGLVPPADPPALAAAIADARRQSARWQERSAAARQQVESRYSVQAVMPRWEETLLQAAGRLADGSHLE